MDIEKNKKTLDGYIKFYETMSRRSLPLIQKYIEDDMRFKDPFNDVRGLPDIVAIFEHMFKNVNHPKFRVQSAIFHENGITAYLRWTFTYDIKGKKRVIEGMSEIGFSMRGLVNEHIDYWDSGEYFYQHIPVLGSIIRWIKSKLAV